MKLSNIFLTIFVICFFSFLAGLAYGADCTYTNVINYNKEGDIVGATQKYECKTPPPKIMTKIDPHLDPVEIIYPDSYYNTEEDRDNQQLEKLYKIFLMLGKVSS